MFNVKSISTTLSVLAFASAAHAESKFTGVYGGIGAGGRIQATKVNAVSPNNNQSEAFSPSSKGFAGNLFLGYGKTFCCKGPHVGIEILAALYTGKTKLNQIVNGDAQKFSMKNSGAVQLAARFGYALENLLPYVKVGVDRSKFTLKSFDANALAANNDPLNVSKSKTQYAMLLGAGVEAPITDHVFVGAEYTAVLHKNMTFKHGVTRTFKTKPTNHALTLRALYRY